MPAFIELFDFEIGKNIQLNINHVISYYENRKDDQGRSSTIVMISNGRVFLVKESTKDISKKIWDAQHK